MRKLMAWFTLTATGQSGDILVSCDVRSQLMQVSISSKIIPPGTRLEEGKNPPLWAIIVYKNPPLGTEQGVKSPTPGT